MPDRSRKQKRREEDENTVAAAIVEAATGRDPSEAKNPAAVALGRLGGLKGGKARAEKLSARRRKQIAKKAAEARWSKRSGDDD